MDISKSSEKSSLIASLLIFSGRRNPTWQPDASLWRKLLDAWEALSLAQTSTLAGGLGSLGVSLEGTEDGWTAVELLVKRISNGEVRLDPDRRFQKLILSTAPSDILELARSVGL